MSPGELLWRCQGKARDLTDRLLRPWRSRPQPLARITAPPTDPARKILGQTLLGNRFTDEEDRRWRDCLVEEADRIADNRLDLFDLVNHDLGKPIDWNYEYKAKKHTPVTPAAGIDYRDYRVTGDCKFVWEPNRHQHWVVLGRAYRITKDERYAAAIAQQFDSWIEQCPFGLGMNWRSPLELGIRLISWAWAFELIADSPVMTKALHTRILQSVQLHLREITRKYSRYSSANNHLIGEAAGVFVAASCFNTLKHADRRRSHARDILLAEIFRQTFPDGGTREQATGYHLFVLEFYLLAGLAARNAGDDFPPEYWQRVEKMVEFVACMSEGTGQMPMIGDADDGYVINLGGRSCPELSWLCVGAVLFNRPDFKTTAGSFRETAFWLLGAQGRTDFDAMVTDKVEPNLHSRALPTSGYYILQAGRRDAPDRMSLTFDAGQLGFLSIAAHGHADALSLVLSIGGHDVLVDAGTYDYFTYPKWRCYFRGTRAHNTLAIDGQDQSEMLGGFLWGRQARCQGVEWKPTNDGGTISAEHDGYRSLPDPVIHRRVVTLDGKTQTVVVRDTVQASGIHQVAVYWNFAETCRVEPCGNHEFEVHFGGGRLVFAVDSKLTVSLNHGQEDPPSGWVSRGYHLKSPAPALIARCESDGELTLTTRIAVLQPERPCITESAARNRVQSD